MNFWTTEGDETLGVFGIIFLIIAAAYFLGGYFIFKPPEPMKAGTFIAVLNGLLISTAFILIFGKLAEPTLSSKVFILFLSPLILVTAYIAVRGFRATESLVEKSHFRVTFIKNLIIIVATLIITAIPPDTFAKYTYGSDSDMYYKTLQNNCLTDGYALRRKGEYEMALNKIDRAIEYAELQNDRSSALYQECINELGYIHYMNGKFMTADSLADEVLNLYKFENPESIKEKYEYTYQKVYYDATYTKALLYSSWGYYHQSDSLFATALKYYTDHLALTYIYSRLGDNQRGTGHFAIADSLYAVSIVHHEKTGYEDKGYYLSTLISQAGCKAEISMFREADSILTECYSFAKNEFGLSSVSVAYVLDAFVSLKMKTSKYEAAKEYCLESLKIKEENLTKKHQEYISSALDLTTIYLTTSKFKQADKLLQETLTTVETNFDNRSPVACRVYDQLTEYYEDLMQYDRAAYFGHKSLAGREYWNGKYNIKTATSYHNMASVLYHQSQYKEADSLYVLALQIKDYYTGDQTLNYASSLNGLSLIYIEWDSLKLAKEYLDFCLRKYEMNLGTKHPDYATILHNLAYLYMKEQRFDKANEHFNTAQDIYRQVFGANHINIARTFYEMGNLEIERKRIDKAIQRYAQAFNLYRDLLGNDHYFVTYLNRTMAALKEKLNKRES